MIPGKGRLSVEGLENLNYVMSILDFPRPDTLKIAFAKGIANPDTTLEIKTRPSSGSEYPYTVLANAPDDVLLYKHLIYNKVGRMLDMKELEKYIVHFVEEGLQMMADEAKELSGASNYLLYLADKHSVGKN